VIQDIDGAAFEPSRRSHVAVLSAATTAVALVLLVALYAPGPRADKPQVAAIPPTPTDSTVVTVASDSQWIRYPDRNSELRIISEVRAASAAEGFDSAYAGESAFITLGPGRDATSRVCAVGIGSSPPVHLVFDRSGQLVAAYTSGKTGRFIPLPQSYVSSGWLSVPCDTPDVFAPRLNRAR
jgi:hypothetical protein